jgi:hypothetical protein
MVRRGLMKKGAVTRSDRVPAAVDRDEEGRGGSAVKVW